MHWVGLEFSEQTIEYIHMTILKVLMISCVLYFDAGTNYICVGHVVERDCNSGSVTFNKFQRAISNLKNSAIAQTTAEESTSICSISP